MIFRNNDPVEQRFDDDVGGVGGSGGQDSGRGDIQARLRRVYLDPEETDGRWRLLGLLFAHPAAPAFEEIRSRLDYWHYRSGKRFNFLTVGYSHAKGEFDEELFADSVRWLNVHSGWTYSGSTDLVLMNATSREGQSLQLDTGCVVALSLEAAMDEGLVRSIPEYIERVCAFADAYKGDDPTWGFSDAEGKRLGLSGLKALLINCLPKALRKDARAAFHVHVREHNSGSA